MDLGIAIVSYNTRELTRECLASVYRGVDASRLSAQVWLIDNASSDGSAQMVAEAYPQARLIARRENLGFARATNMAIDSLSSLDTPPRHVLLLNPDTRVVGDAIGLMVSFLDGHPGVGVVGAQLLHDDGSFQHGAFRFPTLWMAFFDFWPIHHRLLDSRLNGRYPRQWYESGRPFQIDHPIGADMMMRWEAIQQVGSLDVGYFMYCEEIDWCLRARGAGWEAYCVPEAKIVHLVGQSTRQLRDEMFVALWRSRYRLFARHYGRAYQAMVRVIVRAGLKRQMRATRRAAQLGEIGEDEAHQRLVACRRVMEM